MIDTSPLAHTELHGFVPGRARTRRPRRVVVAIGVDGASATAIARAERMSRALDAGLTIVHVIPSTRSFGPLTREIHEELVRATPLVRLCIGPVRRWTEALLARPLRPGALVIGHGPVLETLREAIGQIDPTLLVLGPGRLAQRLASRERRPLLVARPPTETARIVATTDFSDPNFPVLRRAAELGHRLKAEVTFVASASARTTDMGPDDGREPRVRALSARFGDPIDVLFSARPGVDAALEAAHERRADLLVVGSRADRLGGLEDAGQRVADAASCSVLLVPLGGRSRAG